MYRITEPSNSLLWSFIAGPGKPVIVFTPAAATIPLSSGAVVGSFRVTKGTTRAYSFTAINGTSVYAVAGSTMVAGIPILSSASVSFKVQANDGAGSVVTSSFMIAITLTGVKPI